MFDQKDQIEEPEVDEAEVDEEPIEDEVTEPEAEATEADDELVEEGEGDEAEGDEPEAQEVDDFQVSFADDEAKEEPEAAPEWARELRKRHRDTAKENKELKAKLEALSGAKEKAKLGEKPTLAACDYDEDKFEAELASWHDQRRNVEKQKQAEAEAAQAEEKAWQERLDGYNEGKKDLASKAKDFEDAEDELRETFSPLQQGALLHVAKNAPLLVYALGKNPKKAQQLAGINDQALFIAELVRLESEMKVKNVKTAPKPERRVGGTGGVPKSASNALEKARAKAAETGDYTEVNRLKKQMRKQK